MTIANQSESTRVSRFIRLLIAAALLLTGLYLVGFGNSWGPIAFELLADSEIGAWLELVVPFLPMLFIGIGAALFASYHRSRKSPGPTDKA